MPTLRRWLLRSKSTASGGIPLQVLRTSGGLFCAVCIEYGVPLSPSSDFVPKLLNFGIAILKTGPIWASVSRYQTVHAKTEEPDKAREDTSHHAA